MYRHKARLTPRRREILILIAKGYNNDEISKAMDLSIMNTKLQKWRLYCYLGDIHTALDAVYMGLQQGLLQFHQRLCFQILIYRQHKSNIFSI